ncbi:MAG: hypothetical protein ACYCVD_12880 [Desulfitobacteriaceae bacterium]
MFSKGTLWAGAISGGIAQIKDTNAYAGGKIKANEYAAQTTTNVAGAFGLMAGFEYGAVLGSSLLPGIGTIAGTILGGILGDRLGNVVGTQIGNVLFGNEFLNNLTTRN